MWVSVCFVVLHLVSPSPGFPCLFLDRVEVWAVALPSATSRRPRHRHRTGSALFSVFSVRSVEIHSFGTDCLGDEQSTLREVRWVCPDGV